MDGVTQFLATDMIWPGGNFLDCNMLYEITGGYAHEGGKYDAAQSWLAENGWRYDIENDGWRRMHPDGIMNGEGVPVIDAERAAQEAAAQERELERLARRFRSWPEWLAMHKPTVTARLKKYNAVRQPGYRIRAWYPKLSPKIIEAKTGLRMSTRQIRDSRMRAELWA